MIHDQNIIGDSQYSPNYAEISVFSNGKTESKNWLVNLLVLSLRRLGYQVAFLERECSTYGHLTMSAEFRPDPAGVELRLILQNNAALFDIKADHSVPPLVFDSQLDQISALGLLSACQKTRNTLTMLEELQYLGQYYVLS